MWKTRKKRIITTVSFGFIAVTIYLVICIRLSNDSEENHLLRSSSNLKYNSTSSEINTIEKLIRTVHFVKESDTTIEAIKKVMATEKEMTNYYDKLLKAYKKKPDKTYNKLFYDKGYFKKRKFDPQCLYNNIPEKNFYVIPHFANALLAAYAKDNSLQDYLAVVEHIIIKTDKKLNKWSIIMRNDPTIMVNSAPWETNWYEWSVPFTRMMAMYEYIGGNVTIKNICHRRITEILPKLGTSFNTTRDGINFAYLSIPRMLTDYYKDKSAIRKYSRDELKLLNDVLNIKLSRKNIIRNAVYSDYSSIFHDFVPTYSYLLTLGGFYVDTYKALGFQSNVEELVTRQVLPKILHPDLPFTTFGLYGRGNFTTSGNIMNVFWPKFNQKELSDYGVHIMPFMGVGIFKSEKLMFSLRVQRKGMAAYESDPDNGEYALGWVQMRKLYLTDVFNRNKDKYDKETNWKKLAHQPGVIMEEFDKPAELYSCGPGSTMYYFTDVVQSYIGRLPKDKVLFWINKYKFTKYCPNMEYYKCLLPYGDEETEIHEYGVCTENGIVMQYKIVHTGFKRLKIKVVDDDNDMHFESEPVARNGFVVVSKYRPIVNLRMVFNATTQPRSVYWNDERNYMKFNYNNNEYYVEAINSEYFSVRTSKGDMIIGSSNCDSKDVFRFNNKNYIRDSKSLMYLAEDNINI